MVRAVRWGIHRAGGIAATVGADAAASPGSRVAAVAFRDLDRSVVLAEPLGAARASRSYDRLVAEADGPIVRTEEITVATAQGSRTERHRLPAGNGYGPEVAEVQRCQHEGATDSPDMPPTTSLGVLEVLDEVRRQTGVHDPGEEE